MVKNKALADLVCEVIFETLKTTNIEWMKVYGGDDDFGKEIVKAHALVQIDQPEKVRIYLAGHVGYGYDFEKSDSAQKIYRKAVENVSYRVAGEFGESLLAEGIIDDKIGWYITKL